jgi:very-short-patch-repair endonuclease
MPHKKIITGQKISRKKLQRAKELRQEMTEEETILWDHLRTNKLGGFHFRRQQIIDGFIIDFYCHAADLIFEIDGKIHERQVAYDEERSRVLSARGLRIMRIKNEDIHNDLQGVLAQILNACRESSSPPSPQGKGSMG